MNTIISMKTFDFVFPDEDKLDLNEGAVDVDGRCTLPSVEDEEEDHLGGYSSGPVVDLQPRLSLDLMISHLKIVNIDQINQNTRSLSV